MYNGRFRGHASKRTVSTCLHQSQLLLSGGYLSPTATAWTPTETARREVLVDGRATCTVRGQWFCRSLSCRDCGLFWQRWIRVWHVIVLTPSRVYNGRFRGHASKKTVATCWHQSQLLLSGDCLLPTATAETPTGTAQRDGDHSKTLWTGSLSVRGVPRARYVVSGIAILSACGECGLSWQSWTCVCGT